MEETIKIPEEVNAKKEGFELVLTGPLGELRRKIVHPLLKFEVSGDEIKLISGKDTRRALKIVKTYLAHIKNMIKGVTKGFTYKMKVVYTHFPVNLKVDGDKLVIENFIGERSPRYAKIKQGVDVKVSKTEIILTGIDIEAVSQTASNIEQAARITGKDRRIFQDGIYIVEKGK